MRWVKFLIIGVAILAFGFGLRSVLLKPIKVPIVEMLVPFQGEWRAVAPDTGNITDITICADRRESPHAITVTAGSVVRHYGLTSYTGTQHGQHLAGQAFWLEHPEYPAPAALVAVDIRREGDKLLFTLATSTSDGITSVEPSSVTLVCTPR